VKHEYLIFNIRKLWDSESGHEENGLVKGTNELNGIYIYIYIYICIYATF
jgi:hypothetical protein